MINFYSHHAYGCVAYSLYATLKNNYIWMNM